MLHNKEIGPIGTELGQTITLAVHPNIQIAFPFQLSEILKM